MKPLSLATYGCYTTRDTMTVFASFTLPPLVARRLEADAGLSAKSATTLAQLVTPCAIQLLSSPIHLWGMDMYNRPAATLTAASTRVIPTRLAFVAREYVRTTAARIGRIFPAYGIGGVINTRLRAWGKGAGSTS